MAESPIPRRIHYCWLSDDPLPELQQRCLASWKRHLPGYEIVRWDMPRARAIDNRFLHQAIDSRAWAFAADYLRLHALATEGGLYLDSDVEVFRSFDPFLRHRAFSAIEHWPEIHAIGIEGAILGSEPGHPWIRDCLAYYADRNFLGPDGKKDETIISGIIAGIAAERYGFRHAVEEQHLAGDIHLYPPIVLTHTRGPFSETETHALHHCVGSWRAPKPLWKRALRRLLKGRA
ncbi:glycosyltransferase [Luteolibacter sp. LG18]|uniref:glycosyltransferase family 32 protein n=1 Tax=Luteolibacter sp. LG18 TaxID=2819286 RepID=UPI002B2F0691|nr:glycosyl transferase [Luteolibacter sp. LG18]